MMRISELSAMTFVPWHVTNTDGLIAWGCRARLQARHGSDNEKLLFHGTHNRCLMGDAEAYKELCEAPTCKLCAILGTSFLVSKAGSAGRAFKRYVLVSWLLCKYRLNLLSGYLALVLESTRRASRRSK